MALNLPDPGQSPWATQLNSALEQLDAQTAIGGTVSGDNLILTRNNGTTINAGNVRGPAGPSGASDAAVSALVANPASSTGQALETAIGAVVTEEVEPIVRRSGSALSATAGGEFPRLINPVDAPIFSYSTAINPLNGLYWPTFVDLTRRGGTGVALLFSSDHASTHAASGIGKAHAASPLDPFIYDGRVWRDDTDVATQCETPSIIGIDRATGDWLVSYQMAGVPGTTAAQVSMVARCTSADFSTGWSRVGVMTDTDPFNQVAGATAHTGYAVPWESGGQYFAATLLSGASSGSYYASRRMLTSQDGKKWTADARPMWQWTSLIENLPGFSLDNRWGMEKMLASAPFRWQGAWWVLGAANAGFSGGEVVGKRLVAMRVSDDFRRPTSRPVDVTPAQQSWMTAPIDEVGSAFSWDNRLFIPFRTGGRTGKFGVLEIV